MPSPAPRLCRVPGRDAWHIYHERRRVTTGTSSRAEAERALADYIRRSDLTAPEIASLAVILDRYLADRVELALPGAVRLKYAHIPLSRYLGDKPVEIIGEPETRIYTARRRADGVKDATIRTELQALRAAWGWAHKKGMASIPPDVKMPQRPEPRVRFLTRAEADRLLDGCGASHVRLFCLIGLHTAARSGAILGLTWDRVDFGSGTIDFRPPGYVRTAKRKVVVPMNATLRTAMDAAHKNRVTEYVIEYAGAPVAKIKHAFANAVERAGLTDATPHTLRHTAVTWALQEGASVWDVAGFAGMTTEMVQSVYGHHAEGSMRRVAGKLG